MTTTLTRRAALAAALPALDGPRGRRTDRLRPDRLIPSGNEKPPAGLENRSGAPLHSSRPL
jgi:hypothetical protein